MAPALPYADASASGNAFLASASTKALPASLPCSLIMASEASLIPFLISVFSNAPPSAPAIVPPGPPRDPTAAPAVDAANVSRMFDTPAPAW